MAAENVAAAAGAPAQGEAPKFAGVFDLDLTLADLSPVMEVLHFFFPELYFDGGVVTFPAAMKEGLNETAAQKKIEDTWAHFTAYKNRAYTLFARLLLIREIRLHTTKTSPLTKGCLIRPIMYRILYTLKNTPGCQGLMILSNNTLRPCVELANYLLFGLGRQFKMEGTETPPFDTRLLLHHGHRYRETERSQQLSKTGRTRNDTLKSLWTVQEAFNQIGKKDFAALLGTPALPYANVGDEEIPKTKRIFFADDLGDEHQLQRELENEEAQFMNCAPYTTETHPRELLALFWSAWIEASSELAAGQHPLALFVEYFDWLLDREFWTFGPLLDPKRDPLPTTIDAKADLFQRRCSRYTFRVPADKILDTPTEYPTTRANYTVWNEDPLLWLDKLSEFHENLESENGAKGGRRRRFTHSRVRKSRTTRKHLRKTRKLSPFHYKQRHKQSKAKK